MDFSNFNFGGHVFKLSSVIEMENKRSQSFSGKRFPGTESVLWAREQIFFLGLGPSGLFR